MKWNVFIEHDGKIIPFNIFNNRLFADAVTSLVYDPHNEDKDREWFSDQIKQKAQWQFWSRCEYEVLVLSWPPHEDENGHKMDVYEQLTFNWERFMDYIMLWRKNYWNYEKNIKVDCSDVCSKDDDNDAHCWGCVKFNFPIGCMWKESDFKKETTYEK